MIIASTEKMNRYVGMANAEPDSAADSAKVERTYQRDDADRERHRVVTDELDRRADVGHTCGRRDSDGEDVVDEQGAGDEEAEGRPQILGDDLVVASTAGVGMNVLPV